MNAAILREIGAAPSAGTFDDPVAADGHQVVDVAVAGVNPVDLALASGQLGEPAVPSIVGKEGVGVLRDGRRVYFDSPVSPFGSWAEQALIDADIAARETDGPFLCTTHAAEELPVQEDAAVEGSMPNEPPPPAGVRSVFDLRSTIDGGALDHLERSRPPVGSNATDVCASIERSAGPFRLGTRGEAVVMTVPPSTSRCDCQPPRWSWRLRQPREMAAADPQRCRTRSKPPLRRPGNRT
jgi:hypothetical protein